ncbi:MAG TPA: PP2C family protein-serine/threonine phosphatase [Myxococcota bacterium]|nr:PP2C family protein-serine/threonine phosphatase [Myxococcota bacterium]
MSINQCVRQKAQILFLLLMSTQAFAMDGSQEIRCGAVGVTGRRDGMEDAHYFKQYDRWFFAGVYDGFAGDGVSKALARLDSGLHQKVLKNLEATSDYAVAISTAFKEEDTEILESTCAYHLSWGATAAIVLIDQKTNELICANVGDSEVVLISAAEQPKILTTIHQPTDIHATDGRKIPLGLEEKARVEKSGGHVFFNRVQGALSISRAFGAKSLKPLMVISEPAIRKVSLANHHRYVVIACDGLWDVLSAEFVSDFILKEHAKETDPKVIACALVKTALEKGSQDNVTAVVIILPHPKSNEQAQ